MAAGELALEAVPAERRAAAERRGAELAAAGRGAHRRRAPAPRRARRQVRRAAQALRLRHRRHRQHLRRRRAGPGGRPRRRRRDRRHPHHGPEPARLRALRRDHRGLRRHLRHAGELQAHAGRPRRGRRRARPLHPPLQLRERPVHARDRHDGRPRAPRHDAERLHVRHHLPQHQHAAHVRRPVPLAAHQRPRRHHHQHRRGQLPDHGRRLREGLHGRELRLHQRGLRPARQPRALADRPWARLRDQPGDARPGRLPGRRRAAHPPALPRVPAQVHAAHQVHAGRHLPGPHHRRHVQLHRHLHRPGDHAAGHAHRGPAHARCCRTATSRSRTPSTSSRRAATWPTRSSSARAA